MKRDFHGRSDRTGSDHRGAIVRQPTWLVSTPHSCPSRTYGGRVRLPYGTQHARKVGSPLTACGVGAFDWELFWEAPFPHDPSSSCHDCLQATAREKEIVRAARRRAAEERAR